MKLIEFKKIILATGNIEKLYPNKKFNFTLREIYIVNIKGKKKRMAETFKCKKSFKMH